MRGAAGASNLRVERAPTPLRGPDRGDSMAADDREIASLELLGTWRLLIDGDVMAVPGRDQRVIAAIALLDPLPRRQLAEMLWPDASHSHAAANLRVNLSDIRRRCPGVLTSSDPLALAPTVTVDVPLAKRLPTIVERGASRSQLWEWLEFTRRAELLPGWFDSWLEFEQERIRRARLVALDGLGRRFLDVGDAEGALAAAAIALADEPWRETSYELRMRAHVLEGNRALALRDYEHARSKLLRDLDVEPAPILTRLAAELRDGRPV
ncbi:AfsR/SARP family transcriptional regulator [Agromyces binzhouensis]|uniref:AfsR/SARP family transcriptional regulator n=1 Tax=Agromyces binzhouensis TaxID=1817495 RepID=UPI00362D733C